MQLTNIQKSLQNTPHPLFSQSSTDRVSHTIFASISEIRAMACVVETSHAARTVQPRLTGVANVALPENSHITIREALCDKVSASRIKSLQFDIGTNELVTSELDYQFCWEHDKDQPQLEHFTCTEDSSLLQKELPEPPKEIKVAVCENSAVGSCIAGSSGDPDNLSKTSETLHVSQRASARLPPPLPYAMYAVCYSGYLALTFYEHQKPNTDLPSPRQEACEQVDDIPYPSLTTPRSEGPRK